MKRARGSVRFDTYYKVQWFDERACAWRDVQQAHATVALAREAFMAERRCRVMEIAETGRRVAD